LKQSVEKLAMQFAEKAVSSADADYDPKNEVDQKQARSDELDDRQFDGDSFDLKMYKTESKASKNGKAEAYDVYFGDVASKERADKCLKAAITSFEKRNKAAPNAYQIFGIEKFLATQKETKLIQFKLSQADKDADANGVDEDDEASESVKVLITPVKEKKSSAVYNVYFDDKAAENENAAIEWFERFNNRKPTAIELKRIQSFVKHDKSELIECEFDVSKPSADKSFNDDCKSMEPAEVDAGKALKMRTYESIKKSKSTKYTLDFVDDETRTKGDSKQAQKWFEIFNNRKPNKEELEAISNFVKADMNQMIDID